MCVPPPAASHYELQTMDTFLHSSTSIKSRFLSFLRSPAHGPIWSLRFRLLAFSRGWHTEKTNGPIDICNYNNYKFNYCAGTDFSKILSSIYGSMGRIPIKARKERQYFCWFGLVFFNTQKDYFAQLILINFLNSVL